MARTVGTVSRGIRAPIIRPGEDLVSIVANSVMEASAENGFSFSDKDVVCVTETILAKSQGNFATIEQIGADVAAKFPQGTVGVLFPILSRNRFSIVLKGIAKGAKKVVLMLSYPSDEVGNHLVSIEQIESSGVNPYTEVLTEQRFFDLFGKTIHPFTQMNYVEYYKELIKEQGAQCEIYFSNNCVNILKYTDSVLCCDIHTRAFTKEKLKKAGAVLALGMDDILTASVDGSGYNSEYGLLGTNKSTETSVKLFPRDSMDFADKLSSEMCKRTGKQIEAMVYGDGAFKDPVGKIWELADPVVSPGYTKGLDGLPNEIKLKYVADNDFKELSGEALKTAITKYIREKNSDLMGKMVAQGTTPRRITDLIGSLCDLTSGSGDKGTPIVLVQGYFDNYAD